MPGELCTVILRCQSSPCNSFTRAWSCHVTWNVTKSRTDNLTEVKAFLRTNTSYHFSWYKSNISSQASDNLKNREHMRCSHFSIKGLWRSVHIWAHWYLYIIFTPYLHTVYILYVFLFKKKKSSMTANMHLKKLRYSGVRPVASCTQRTPESAWHPEADIAGRFCTGWVHPRRKKTVFHHLMPRDGY